MASAAITTLSLMLPLALLQVYDRIIPNQSHDTAFLLGVAVATAIFIEILLRVARSVLLARAGQKYERQTGTALFNRILGADPRALSTVGAGEHLDRFNSVGAVREFESGQPMILVFDVVFAVIFIAVIAVLGGVVAFWPLAAIACAIAVTLIATPALRRKANAQLDTDSAANDFLISALGGAHSIRALGMEVGMIDRYQRLQADRITAQARSEKIGTHLGDFTGFLAQSCTVCIVCHGAVLVNAAELTTGALAACTILSGRTMQPLRSAINMWTRYLSVTETRRRMDTLMNVAQVDHRVRAVGEVDSDAKVEFANVSFRAPGAEVDLIPPTTTSIQAGSIVAIIGPNASGKSTLLQIMSGETVPTTGSVLIDGEPIENTLVNGQHSGIARLSQADTLFRGSIIDNLTGYRSSFRADAIEATRFLGFADEIDLLPQGFDTSVTEIANTFSRGFVQRVSLVRALLDRPSLLLADQAFAAMDATGKGRVIQLFKELRGHSTIVMVTYDTDFLGIADEVIDLWAGKPRGVETPTIVVDDSESLRRAA